MKKCLLCLLFGFIALSVNAQTVMGINIKTTMKSFLPQMAKKGYKPHKTTLGKYEFTVKFAGYPNCTYEVEYNTETDSIYYVAVHFLHESVKKDEEIYNDIKQQLIAKYGKPSHDFDVDYADLGASVIARMSYRDVSFNSNPYLVWHFDDKKYVRLSYQTGARRKPSKVSYSNDL